MKKAVILISTLFFVMFVSFAMLENLKSSEKLIETSNDGFSHTQMMILVNNYKDEIGALLVKNKENLDDIIFDDVLKQKSELNFYDIKSSFELVKLEDLYNINDMFSTQTERKEIIESFFLQNGVDYDNFKIHIQEYLQTIDKELDEITSLKQVHQLLDYYLNKVEVYNLQNIKQNLYFMDFSANKTYVLCNLNLELYNKRFTSKMIFDMQSIQNNKAGVMDFDIVFK